MPVRGLRPSTRGRSARPSLLRLRGPTARRPEDLQALREVLVGPEQVRLEQIERGLPNPQMIGELLPEAVAHASEIRPAELATAAAKPVTGALRDLARQQPELFAEILAPTIGTAVRRAVTEALVAMLQRMNQLLECSLSLRSIKWRIEAMRTGRTFAEVVLSHSLVYRVEWVVLIHSESSLVLEQAAWPDSAAQAPDQIAAMLQAISAFVSEAFQPAIPGAELHTLQVGDLTVWIERDPAFTLAVAIRGVAPLALRERLRETIDRVRTLHHDALADRVPDVASFADTHPLLEDCLGQQLRATPRRAQWLLAVVGIAALVAAGLLTFRGVAADRRDAELVADYYTTLSSAPGIVVTSIERAGDRYRIEGLRDPRADPPDELIAGAGLPAAELAFAPFDSLDPRFEGPLAATDAAIRALEEIAIDFPRGHSLVSATDPAVARAAELVSRAQRAAAGVPVGLCVEILGHTDESGSAAVNIGLRSARAANVAHALHLAGVATELLRPRAADPTHEPVPTRRVTFHAALRPQSQGCPP